MNIKRIIFGGIAIVLFLGGFLITNTFAQSNGLCSTTLRNELARTDQDTYKILYNITDPLLIKYIDKNYANFNLNKTISGEPLWYDNKKGGCSNLGTFVLGSYNLEKDNWNNFRNKYGSIAGIVNGNELSQSTVTNMQNYIKNYCGFNMGIDGQLGKKTINSINICKPPALGYLTWAKFEEMYLKLYLDVGGTQPIYTGNQFKGNPSEKLHFRQSDFPSQQPSPGLGLVIDNSVTNGTSALAGTSNVTDINNSTTCRFRPQDGIEPPQEYTNAIANGYEAGDCTTGCAGGYTEVKKGGISVCEKCDIEKCNCGIKLNTNIPFIGRCIMNQQTNNVGQSGNVTTVNTLNAFPILMGALIKLLMSIIMIVCFASLIVGGFMMTVPDQYDTGKGIVKKVIRTIVALGSLGTILYLINPNFFS